MIDSTIIRAHHLYAGAKGDSGQDLGRSRGGFSTKIHLRRNREGLPPASFRHPVKLTTAPPMPT